MKKSLLILMITGFLVIGLSEIQAQTTQPKLNQVELMKQYLGTWKCDTGKDTALIAEFTAFGTCIEENGKSITKGKTLDVDKELWGYDKINDKIIWVQVWNSSLNINLNAQWFTSKNIIEGVPLKDISNPEKAAFKTKVEFQSSDVFLVTNTQNGKVVATFKFTRIKK